MKKNLLVILACVLIALVVISCDDPKHEHSYGTEWKYNDTNHWHECSCGEKTDVAAHTFGDWTVDGTNEKSTCSVCKYEGIREISKWDGTTDTSWYTADTTKKEYTLTSAAQLAGLAELVNGGTGEKNLGDGVSFSGVKINLAVSINLCDKEWTPIGLYGDKEDTKDFSKKVFSGTFDGQGHTISGLKITNDNGKSSYRALFGYADGTIVNFTVEGEIKACDASGVVAALGAGGTVENVVNKVDVTVTTATTDQHAKVAGIVVALKGTSKKNYTIKNCTNSGKITSATTNADKEPNDCIGGILAILWDDVENVTIEGCANSGDVKTESNSTCADGDCLTA